MEKSLCHLWVVGPYTVLYWVSEVGRQWAWTLSNWAAHNPASYSFFALAEAELVENEVVLGAAPLTPDEGVQLVEHSRAR